MKIYNMARCNSGFSLLEVLLGTFIFSIISIAVFSAFNLFLRGTKYSEEQLAGRQQIGFVVYKIESLLENSDKSKIYKIQSLNSDPNGVGDKIIFQVPTPDAVSGSFTTPSGLLRWGDGVTEGKYLCIVQQGSDIVLQHLTINSGLVSIDSSKILLKNATFRVRGLFINNSNNIEYNNTAPSAIDILIEKDNPIFANPKIRRHFLITFRVH